MPVSSVEPETGTNLHLYILCLINWQKLLTIMAFHEPDSYVHFVLKFGGF